MAKFINIKKRLSSNHLEHNVDFSQYRELTWGKLFVLYFLKQSVSFRSEMYVNSQIMLLNSILTIASNYYYYSYFFGCCPYKGIWDVPA